MDFTVAIPTYNSEHRLADVLERLQAQIDCQQINWEIIVVDNNSNDNTAKLVRNYQAKWSHPCPLRYVFAPEQGAAFARQRAIEKAQGRLIGFLDDDNLPALNWVAAAYTFGKEHPKAGAYGSQIHGYFFEQQPEEQLPENFAQIACFLGIIERGNQAYRYEPRQKILPPGAGLVVRKDVWQTTVPKRLVLNHKGKEAGLASEDLEVLLHIQRAGWEIWYNPAMIVDHKIPNSRLQKEYLRLLFRCIGLSRHQLRMLTCKSWQKPLALPAYFVNDLRRLVLNRVKNRRLISSDLVTACQQELLISSLVSPFFLWKKRFESLKLARRSSLAMAAMEVDLLEIAEAFEEDRFCLYTQNINSLTQKLSVNHAEIKLCLKDKTGKVVLPGQFKATVEHYKLGRTLDRWVIRNLLSKIAKAEQSQQSLYQIRLSADSINDDQFLEFLQTELASHQVAPQVLNFSIAADVAIASLGKVIGFIYALKAFGCRFTLDCVGSLDYPSYLEQLPVDYLKVDQNWLLNVALKSGNLHQNLRRCRDLGIAIIAMTDNQEQLLELGVDYIQSDSMHPLADSEFNLDLTVATTEERQMINV